jgi:hypothetical protein
VQVAAAARLVDPATLDIAYRGSEAPQALEIRLRLPGTAELPLAAWAVGTLVECVNRGLAGGAEFAPGRGFARLVAGPTGEGPEVPGELGPELRFQLEVAGVSPRFIRTIVEYLAPTGHPHAALVLTVVGGLAPDGTRLSVRGVELARWLDDPALHPEAWSAPGFRVTPKVAPRGASVRVRLQRALTAEVAIELERTISAWQSAVLTYPNLAGDDRGLMDPHCTFARTRTDLLARVSLFDHATAPTRDQLVNALAWFHERVAPIAEVEIAMP